jgi:hypothetical protein
MDHFVPSTLGMAAIARSEELQEALRELAEPAAEESRRIARDEAYLSGDYEAGIEVEVGEENDEALARINANDWKSWWIEAGTSDTPTFAVLRRGAEAVGLDVQEGES